MKVKPTGLKGNDKIQRIQNLMDKLSPLNESVNNSSLEHVKYGPDGTTYGIIRENHTYFIKTSNKRSDKLTSDDFNYVGGLQNKMNESYRSYEEALKHLNMRFKDLNESYGIRENINLFRSDLLSESKKKKSLKKEEDEETKYTLKVDSPEGDSTETVDTTTTDVPMDSMPTEPAGDVPTDDGGMGDVETTDVPDETPVDDEGGSDEESGDLEKDIQRLTGKIGQKMRELDEPNPELEKYVMNSIMSALDIDSMDDDFKEDLISKLEGEENEEEPANDETTDEEPVEEEPTDEEPVEEEPATTSEGRIISKKYLMEKVKSKKILKNKLKRTIKESNKFYGKFRDMGDDEWIESHSHKPESLTGDDWDEETYDDYPSFSKKYPKHSWFSGRDEKRSGDMFDSYRKKYGPLSIRKKKSLDDEMLDEEKTTTRYKDVNDFKTNGPKLGSNQEFSIDGIPGNFMKEMNEDENLYEIELDEDWMEEGNKFTDMLRKTKKGGTFKLGGKTYKDTSDYDSHSSKKRRYMDEDDDIMFNNPKEREDDDLDIEIEDLPGINTPLKPDEDEPYNPFKPKIKPEIQPKGGYEEDKYFNF